MVHFPVHTLRCDTAGASIIKNSFRQLINIFFDDMYGAYICSKLVHRQCPVFFKASVMVKTICIVHVLMCTIL